jgi:hypothetical protein
MNQQPDRGMINVHTTPGRHPDAVSVTFRANWALTQPEVPAHAVGVVTNIDIPPLRPAETCARCSHGLHDVIGFVVAYSHLSDAGVRFADIAYVGGARSYAKARELRDEAIARIQRREVKATYAVVHWVYEGGHRTS